METFIKILPDEKGCKKNYVRQPVSGIIRFCHIASLGNALQAPSRLPSIVCLLSGVEWTCVARGRSETARLLRKKLAVNFETVVLDWERQRNDKKPQDRMSKLRARATVAETIYNVSSPQKHTRLNTTPKCSTISMLVQTKFKVKIEILQCVR